jgi:hypothetical protein
MGLIVWPVVTDADLQGQSSCHQICPDSLQGQMGRMTGPERSQHGGAQGELRHESGDLMAKCTHQLGKKCPISAIHGAESEQRCAELHVLAWTGTAWKCACRDQACAQSYWQIQFEAIPGDRRIGQPPTTSGHGWGLPFGGPPCPGGLRRGPCGLPRQQPCWSSSKSLSKASATCHS